MWILQQLWMSKFLQTINNLDADENSNAVNNNLIERFNKCLQVYRKVFENTLK